MSANENERENIAQTPENVETSHIQDSVQEYENTESFTDDETAIAEIEAMLNGAEGNSQPSWAESENEIVPYSGEGETGPVVPVNPPEETESQAYVSEEEKNKLKNKRNILIAIIAASVLLILTVVIIICAASCGGNGKDDPKKTPVAVMFIKDTSDGTAGSIEENGDLYIAEPGKERELVASDVHRYGMEITDDNNLFYQSNGSLYVKMYGKPTERIATATSFMVSEDGKAVFYEDNETIYMHYLNGGTEKISNNVSGQTCYVRMSADGKVVYYTDTDGNFFIWTSERGSEKVDSGVGYVDVDEKSYFYALNSSQGSTAGYIKLANDTSALRIDENEIYNVKFTKNELAAFMQVDCSYGEELWEGDLCAYVSGGTAIRIAPDVINYTVTEDDKYLYYLDIDRTLYKMELPTINRSKVSNPQAFRAQLDGKQKVRIGNDIVQYKVSPNGKNIAMLDSRKNLAVSIGESSIIPICSGVEDFMISDSRLCYVDDTEHIYLNSQIKDVENIMSHNKLIAANAKLYSASPQGKYIMFYNAEKDTIDVCTDGQTPKTVVLDAQTYDYVFYNNVAAFENVMELESFLGKYKNDELGYLFEIRNEDGNYKLDWWMSGSMNTIDVQAYNSPDRFTLSMNAYYDKNHNINRLVQKNGVKWAGYENMNYPLTVLADDEFQAEINKQRAVEKQRENTETRREALRNKIRALEERGRSYMRSGITVTSSTPLYSYHDTDYLYEDVNYGSNSFETVRDYYVTEDGSTLWLELYEYYRGDYIWIKVN